DQDRGHGRARLLLAPVLRVLSSNLDQYTPTDPRRAGALADGPMKRQNSIVRLALACITAVVVGWSIADPSLGLAEETSPPQEASSLAKILEKAAKHAEQFEEMKRRASYTLSWKMEALDGDGNVDGTKEMVMRVKMTPNGRSTEIVKFTEDGVDK